MGAIDKICTLLEMHFEPKIRKKEYDRVRHLGLALEAKNQNVSAKEIMSLYRKHIKQISTIFTDRSYKPDDLSKIYEFNLHGDCNRIEIDGYKTRPEIVVGRFCYIHELRFYFKTHISTFRGCMPVKLFANNKDLMWEQIFVGDIAYYLMSEGMVDRLSHLDDSFLQKHQGGRGLTYTMTFEGEQCRKIYAEAKKSADSKNDLKVSCFRGITAKIGAEIKDAYEYALSHGIGKKRQCRDFARKLYLLDWMSDKRLKRYLTKKT